MDWKSSEDRFRSERVELLLVIVFFYQTTIPMLLLFFWIIKHIRYVFLKTVWYLRAFNRVWILNIKTFNTL